jgi:hypothetical protein
MILFSGAEVEEISELAISRDEAGRALVGESSEWDAIRPGEMILAGEIVLFVPAAAKEAVTFRVKCDQRFVGLSETGNLFRPRR